MDGEAFASSQTLHSFTPVRRRESTINTRQLHDLEQEWTAARCRRLLRALTSRVAILRKELARFSSATQNEHDPGQENARGGKGAAKPGVNEDWTRARKRIRTRQTYSKKNTRNDHGPHENARKARGLPFTKGRKSLVPGEIAVPTPILVRARGGLPAEEPLPNILGAGILEEPARRSKRARTRYMANDGDSQFQLSESLLELRKRITAARYTIYEGIYSGLEALLRATTNHKAEPKRPGPSSLLSMSLRAIPRYITQQEVMLRAHIEEMGCKSAIENRDISTEMYDELESFGSSGHGWKRLRAIVRSHGIQVLSDAIRTGLLDVEFSGVLIALCVNTFAIEEAQALLSALLAFTPCRAPRTLHDIPNRPLMMLWKFTQHTSRFSFQYRQLTVMIANRVLPVEWLVTKEFGPVWTGVIHSLMPGSDNIEALRFLDLTLTMLSLAETSTVRDKGDAITEAVRNTFSSLLTTLSSIVILSRGSANTSPTKEARPSHEYEHISKLLRSCFVQQSHSIPTRDHQSPLLLLANLLVHSRHGISADSNEPFVSALLHEVMRRNDDFAIVSAVYTNVIEFICLVARCCGRGASSSGFEHLAHLHIVIESSIYDAEAGRILKGLIVDSAFAFAQQLPDRKHLEYATAMDEKFCARRFGGEDGLIATSTRGCEEAKNRFRWEEGIEEWVTATPANHLSRKRVAEVSSITEFENDMPFRPSPNLRPRNATVKGGSAEPSWLLCKDNTDECLDLSYVSTQTSEGESDRAVDSVGSISPKSSLGSDDELAAYSQSSPLIQPSELSDSASKVEALSIEASSISDYSSPSAALDKARSSMRHKALHRGPRLNRRLFRNTRDWNLFDESSVSSNSSLFEDESNESNGVERDYVHRAPRLGRRALQSSEVWQIFDESDDELSFLSVPSKGHQLLQDDTNTVISSTRRLRRANPPLIQNKSVASYAVSHSDSEDELCI